METSWVDVCIEVAFGVGTALFFGAQVARAVRRRQGVDAIPSAMDGSFSFMGGKVTKR
jgi:hypothetical protein